ncbi:hypothetical protein ACM66B_000496 [Microbotryomycetes sp. NB124-2]
MLKQLRHLGACSFIALQEVDLMIRRLVEHESWVKRDYLVVCGVGDNGQEDQEGCMLLVRKQLYLQGSHVLWRPLRTAPHERERNGRREIIGVSVFDKSGHEHMRVATVHCSALPINEPLRATQYIRCMDLLRDSNNDQLVSLLLVDTNASHSDELQVFLDNSFEECCCDVNNLAPFYYTLKEDRPDIPGLQRRKQDKWRDVSDRDRPEEQHPTFGHLFPIVPGSNPNRAKHRKPRRIDRIFVRQTGSIVEGRQRWSLESVEPFGQVPVKDDKGRHVHEKTGKDGNLFPSDHAGVWVQLTTKVLGSSQVDDDQLFYHHDRAPVRVPR